MKCARANAYSTACGGGQAFEVRAKWRTQVVSVRWRGRSFGERGEMAGKSAVRGGEAECSRECAKWRAQVIRGAMKDPRFDFKGVRKIDDKLRSVHCQFRSSDAAGLRPHKRRVGALPVRFIGAAAVGARLEPHVEAVADGAVAASVRRAEQVGELVVQVGLRAGTFPRGSTGSRPVLVAEIGKALAFFVEGLVPGASSSHWPLRALADALEGPL